MIQCMASGRFSGQAGPGAVERSIRRLSGKDRLNAKIGYVLALPHLLRLRDGRGARHARSSLLERDGSGAQARTFVRGDQRWMPGTEPAFFGGWAVQASSGRAVSNRCWKECLAEGNALRAQSSFEGALSATRDGSINLRGAHPGGERRGESEGELRTLVSGRTSASSTARWLESS
jgi:hypothetical protein